MVKKLQCHTGLSNLPALVEGQEYYVVSEDSSSYTVINAQSKTHYFSKDEQSASYFGKWLISPEVAK